MTPIGSNLQLMFPARPAQSMLWHLHAGRTLLLGAILSFSVSAFALAAETAERTAQIERLTEKAYELASAGSYGEALAPAKEALELTVEQYGRQHEKTTHNTMALAGIADWARDYTEAEMRYRQVVTFYERQPGYSAVVPLILASLGDMLVRAGKAAEAAAVLDRAMTTEAGKNLLSISVKGQAALGAVRFAQGDFAGSLQYYRTAVGLLTGASPLPPAEMILEPDIRKHGRSFIGLSHAAWALRQQRGGNDAALLEETYLAGQHAWATAAASALGKMTARLKAGDNAFGRLARGVEDMTARVAVLDAEDQNALIARARSETKDAEHARLMQEQAEAYNAQAKANQALYAKQKPILEKLKTLEERCPLVQTEIQKIKIPGCENSEAERQGLNADIAEIWKQVANNSAASREIGQRLQDRSKDLPGFEAHNASREARAAERERLRTQLDADRATLTKAYPDYFALAEPKPLTIAATQAVLRDDEALIAFLVGPEKSFAWAVTRERADWTEIDAGEQVLAEHVAALRSGLDPNASEGLRPFDLNRSHALYTLLLGRLAPLVAKKRHLMIVPTGPLTSLPFHVLIAEPPRTAGSPEYTRKSAAWLIRRHALTVLASVQSLQAVRQLASVAAAPKPYLGIGDPVLAGPAAQVAARSGGRQSLPRLASLYRRGVANPDVVRQLLPLPETADELRAVALSLGAPADTVMLRDHASETRIKSAPLADYRVIHFATHGLVAGELDGLSEPALVLTPPRVASGDDDGLLQASEIATLRLNADWVVLSACNTAAGDNVGADALSGLARAFLFAGAHALLVSHWAVYSDAAVHLTTHTFSELVQHPEIGRGEAFRRSMLSLIDAGRPPAFWAPFVIVGEGGAP